MYISTVCLYREERERASELSLHTTHSHSGKACRSGRMDSMSGYDIYQTLRVGYLVARPDLTQIVSGSYGITSTESVLQMTRDNKREHERSIN